MHKHSVLVHNNSISDVSKAKGEGSCLHESTKVILI